VGGSGTVEKSRSVRSFWYKLECDSGNIAQGGMEFVAV
jgi:hypothetical protein